MPLPENQDEWDNLYIMFATAKGNIRRGDLQDFKKIQANGKIAIRLDEDDKLINIKPCKEDEHILLATRDGKALRFPFESLRVIKSRTSDGVRGMRLASEDTVISMTVLKGISNTREERDAYLSVPWEQRLEIAKGEAFNPEELGVYLTLDSILAMADSEEFILTVTENGFGKRSSAYGYRISSRGGSDVINMDINDKTGLVVGVMPVKMDDELMLITNSGKLIRCKLESVRITGRNTSGVILFKLDNGEKVVSVSLIAESAENDEESKLEEEVLEHSEEA